MSMKPRRRIRSRTTRLILGALLCLPGLTARAAGDPAGEAVDCLRSELGGVEGLRVPYERVILTSSTMLLGGAGAGDQASGLILFEPPHFLKIIQKAPRREIVVGDGSTLWWYIPEKNEARRYQAEAMGQELRALADVFQGLRNVEDHFEVIWEGHSEKGDRRIRLVPDPPWTETDALVLEVTPGCRLRLVEIHNTVGNITRFVLGPIEKNIAFEPGTFTFSVPEGVRVIEGAD